MIGAGVFSAFAPAARAAGSRLLVGLAVAAVVAYCNAIASAQLAAQYPTSGGTYVYGRERLGPWWGFLAGWGFVVGKTASCAAMALTFAAYAVPGRRGAAARRGRRGRRADRRSTFAASPGPPGWRACSSPSSLVALLVVVGRSRRVRASRRDRPDGRRRSPAASTACCSRPACCSSPSPATRGSPRSGRRCATRERTIPRAILLALGIAVVVYAAVGRRRARSRSARRAGRELAARWRRPSTRSARPGPRRSSGVGAAVASARRAAGADRRRRANRAGDGAQRGPARLARRRRTRATACRTAPSSRSAPPSACWS